MGPALRSITYVTKLLVLHRNSLTFMLDLLKVAPTPGVFIAGQLSGFATPLRLPPGFSPLERERGRASVLARSRPR